MKKLTRFVSVLLSALMVASMFTALNFTAFAADSKLTIRANSNIFPTQTQEFDAESGEIIDSEDDYGDDYDDALWGWKRRCRNFCTFSTWNSNLFTNFVGNIWIIGFAIH